MSDAIGPYLTAGLPPVPAKIRLQPEDFFVQELPAYEPSDAGTHCYVLIEKRGLSTMEAARLLARDLGVRPRDVGYAGLKDANAVAQQTFSIEHVDPESLAGRSWEKMRVLSVRRHGNKLRIGHLRGNHFIIRLREIQPQHVPVIRQVLEVLARRGTPNYFGSQRFGQHGDSWRIGLAMIHQDWDRAISVLLGGAGPSDKGPLLQARRLFDEGNFQQAADAWPYSFRQERRACQVLAAGGSAKRAFFSIDRHIQHFYASALQAYLFNSVLAERLNEIDRLRAGDLAWLHRNDRVFLVENADAEQPRCQAGEISPSGPLFGYRMTQAQDEPGRIEQRILESAGLTREVFRGGGGQRIKGARRPLRFCLHELQIDEDQPATVRLSFTLPPGCYATAVLREILKTPDLADTPSAGPD